ncbi:hypothetical protein B0I37DRAFT_123421 [Chaetomium sp. MPI-CAGE-AT-0009]|nr:hypothetical protein B0I37DRAFT_123421 [Chaetomium sp. MPI-CAGE-AT-0009]
MGFQLLYGAALLGASVQAFAFLPRPTDPFQALPVENGWTPRPTPAPEGQGLFKRQISLPSSYLIAPDNTCGFVNGNSRSAYAETTHSRDKSRSMSTVEPKTTSTTKKSTSSTSTRKSSSSTSKASSTKSETASETTSEATSEEPAAATGPPAASTTADSDRSSATTSSTEPVASDAPSTPTGAIVGGILGGIALIALAIFGAILLRRHKKKNMATAELPPPQPFMAQPTYPNTQPPAAPYGQDSASARMSGYAASSVAGTPAHMYAAPAAAGAAGAAAAAAGSFNSYHNHHPSNHTGTYADYHPSPMTTPSGSPQPQYAHQTHAPPPLPVPSYYNNSPRASQDHYRGGNDNSSTVGGVGGAGEAGPVEIGDGAWAGAELPDRRSTSTPVSTYNGTTPVSPASALGPMPGEQQGSGNGGGMSGVPLILQPGMGYRPYRPPGAGAGAGGNGNAAGGAGGNGGMGMVVPRKAVASGASPAARAAQAQGQAQGQAPDQQGQAQGVAGGHQQTAPVELP